MVNFRRLRVSPTASAALGLAACVLPLSSAFAQSPGGSLPAMAPTSLSSPGLTAPIAAAGPSADRAGGRHHHAQVSCTGGLLTVHANNSSLNGILRSVARCTGMTISGGVLDQRVFGDYGPAAPATVLATLLDGTGTNMLLTETAANQPAQLILTPRTAGPTPPSPSAVPDDDADPAMASGGLQAAQGGRQGGTAAGQSGPGQPSTGSAHGTTPQAGASQPGLTQDDPGPGYTNQTPVPVANQGSAVTGPVSIPQPINNVNGSPNSVSPSASTYPTTNSVPLDSLPTPSTTPSSNGIVDTPNPPAPGSDTAHLLQGVNSNAPGTTNIVPAPTSAATSPGGTNTTTTVPAGTNGPTANPPGSALNPQQIYQQLQQIHQQQQQQQAPTTPTPQ